MWLYSDAKISHIGRTCPHDDSDVGIWPTCVSNSAQNANCVIHKCPNADSDSLHKLDVCQTEQTDQESPSILRSNLGH